MLENGTAHFGDTGSFCRMMAIFWVRSYTSFVNLTSLLLTDAVFGDPVILCLCACI